MLPSLTVDVVALISLGTPVEVEAPLLAADLSTTLYEATLLLRTPSPVPLLRTSERERTVSLLAKLRGRGHDAVACDLGAVVRSSDMIHARSFAIEPEALDVRGTSGHSERVPWSTMAAIVRSVHRTRSESVEQTTTTQFDAGRAAMSGGLVATRSVTTSTTHRVEEREPVFYLFRHGGPPMLFAQSTVRYGGLGPALRPAQVENFATLVRLLREHAPRAGYDELLAQRPDRDKIRLGADGAVRASTSDTVDLLAHLVAMAISRPAGSPYRGAALPR